MQNILGIVQSGMVEMQAKQRNVEIKIGEVWAEMARAANRQTPPQVHIICSAPNTSPAPPSPVTLAPSRRSPTGGSAGGGHIDEPQHQWRSRVGGHCQLIRGAQEREGEQSKSTPSDIHF